MKVSREGLLLIKSFEGFRPQAVRRRDGVLVIGYGHSRTARPGLTITEAEAELLLLYDLIPVTDAIHSHVKLALNQHQFDALASFVLSIGVERFTRSDVLQHLQDGLLPSASRALSGWPDRVPPPIDALYRRRSAERALFDTAADQPAALSALLTAPVLGPSSAGVAEEAPAPVTIPVMRHETRARASRPDRADLGALAFIGSIGALALAAGVLAFRRTLPPTEAGDGSMWIGAMLVFAGLAFVGAAAWNLITGRHYKSSI